MKVFATYRNSDLTEGRGGRLFVGLFEHQSDANKAALGIDAQGSDGTVEPVEVHATFETWFAELQGWERERHETRIREEIVRLQRILDPGGKG